MNTYWCNTYNGINTNFGDILTPYIFNKYNFNTIHSTDINNINLYGIGSLLDNIPDNYKGNIWSSGFLMPRNNKKTLLKAPHAIRGKLSLSYLLYDNSPVALGDGGLLIENVYRPSNILKKYKLGIIPHYVDIEWANFDIKSFSIFKNPDVLFIDSNDDVETYINKLLSCENILSSSLHGLIASDAYGINNGLFTTPISYQSLHINKSSFKFKDYYSVFNQEIPKNIMIDTNTTLEECISSCKSFNKPNIDVIKYYLEKSIINMKDS